MMRNTRGSVRALVGLAAAATVIAGSVAGGVTGTSAATLAAPPEDCAEPTDISTLQAGDAVTGKTVDGVVDGVTPVDFDGTVLGVLNDGIAPGVDMVMVEVTSGLPSDPDIGIWQGMSGSPVYAADGSLIGAIAYGLSWGPSPVAGVTPFALMDDYLDAAPAMTVDVNARTAEKIAARTDVTEAQAAEGFSQLRVPLGVSGISDDRMGDTTKRTWLKKGSYRTGPAAAPGEGATVDTVEAGGNLAAAYSWGDITMGGVGTATSVCNNQVVGFGHPMAFTGKTTAGLLPADVIYVHHDGVSPGFKVANFGTPGGTITEDRMTGITGTFGALPDTLDVSQHATFGTRNRTGATEVAHKQFAPSAVLYQIWANQDYVVDGYIPGSQTMSWTITGHTDGGRTFSVDVSDRYASDYDITGTAPWDVADQTWLFSRLAGVTLDEITMEASINDDPSVFRMTKVEQRRAGAWRVVNRKNPIIGVAGKTVRLRVALDSGTSTGSKRVTLAIPNRASGARGGVYLVGGDWLWADYPGNSLDETIAWTKNLVRNDEIQVSMYLDGRRGNWEQEKVTTPATKVVTGDRSIPLRIR